MSSYEKKKPILLVKVGTNLLTNSNFKLHRRNIQNIIQQVAKLHSSYSLLLVSSGAVGAGKEISSPIIPDPITKKQVLASIGQGRLLQIYSDYFNKKKITIAQALLTKKDFQHKESYYSTKEILSALLYQNVIPIINENDVTSSVENTFGDNDQLAALTACLMEVDKMILLTDTFGLYQEDPKKNPKAKFIEQVERINEKIISFAKHSTSKGGSGGMYSKVKAAQIATNHGIPTILCNGNEKNALLKAVKENFGTYFCASEKKNFPLVVNGCKQQQKFREKLLLMMERF